MTSGEWDLCALKALENEEKKEFLALSQRSLFQLSSPSKNEQKFRQQNQLHSNNFTQFHRNKQFTNNEWNSLQKRATIAQKNYGSFGYGSCKVVGKYDNLKFTRALSLSAHSLNGGKLATSNRSTKTKLSFAKSSESVTLPSNKYNVSTLFTPPARPKHAQEFQLEYKKAERKFSSSATTTSGHYKSPQLQRIAGTNKTFWKYAPNPNTQTTTVNIATQRQQEKMKKLKENLKKQQIDGETEMELQSNSSDEYNFNNEITPVNNIFNKNNMNNFNKCNSYCAKNSNNTTLNDTTIYYDDSATETGSCTVPLRTDSSEMMLSILNAATKAVKTSSKPLPFLSHPHKPSTTTTTATTTEPKTELTQCEILCATSGKIRSHKHSQHAPVSTQFDTLNTSTKKCHYQQSPSPPSPPQPAAAVSALSHLNETVAYKAFYALARRQSFAGSRTFMQTAENVNINRLTNNSAVNASGRRLLKSTSVETPNSSIEFKGNNDETINSFNKDLAINMNTKSEMCESAKPLSKCMGIENFSTKQQQQHEIYQPASSILCPKLTTLSKRTPLHLYSSSLLLIDDELEEHIKHCSCSCNHMGYGNSMDYQTTGFGGLPDVTEHSNIRRTLSRQNSISNSESGGEIISLQKAKVNFTDRIKSSTSSCGGDNGIGERSTNTKQHKSKAAHQSNRGTIVQHYKSKRGSLAIGLTLVIALTLSAIAAMLAYQYFFMAPSRNSLTQRLRIVQRILRDVPLVDGHNNFAWNVRKYGQSSLELVHEKQKNLEQKTILTRPAWAQTDMERLKQGLVGVQIWSAYVPCEAQGLDAVQLALEQIDIIHRLADMFAAETSLITSSQDIFMTRRRGLMASLIGIEGGHAIGASLGVLRSLYSLGARYLTLTHRCDVSWAGSSSSTVKNQGLTQFGKAIIREMNRLGMMIDLSHSSDATARDVLQVTRAPVIFSHSAARHLCNSTRNVPDDILRLVAENGGLIMVSFDSEDVACGNGRQARLTDVIEHIKHIRSIAGIQHIGLGAGYDGIEMPPTGLEDVSKYPDLLASLLEDQNWSEEDIAMLAGKNFLRIMETVENVRDYWKRAAIQPIEQTESQPKSQCTYMSS